MEDLTSQHIRILAYIDAFAGEPLTWHPSDRTALKQLTRWGLIDTRVVKGEGYFYSLHHGGRLALQMAEAA